MSRTSVQLAYGGGRRPRRRRAGRARAVAPDGPGTTSYFDLARKDCVGTARDNSSKVWFTVADGVLSDTYWPNVDATNVKTLQYVVTDGRHFTDLQTRDMTYQSFPDPTGMACTVIASNSAHNYRIVTTYFADPGSRCGAHANSVRRAVERPAVRPARRARRRHRRRRRHERWPQQRAAGQLPGRPRAAGVQHQHIDRRRQSQLRRADVRGARVIGRVLERECRLRGDAQ